MRRIIRTHLLLYLLLATLGCNTNKVKITVKDGLKINHSTIITFDSTGKLTDYQGTIVIDSNTVVYAGITEPEIEGTYKSIDATGKYIIPGLIDSHVHLASIAGMNPRHQRKHRDLVNLYFEQLPKSFLFFGYTTLIDLNNYAPSRINSLRDADPTPDIYACGEQVQVMNDFIMEMEEYSIQQRYNMPFLYDHYNKDIHIPDSIDIQSHTVQAITQNILHEQDGICIKMLYEDESSGLKETWAKPSTEILKDVATEARNSNIPLILHAPSFEGQKTALDASVDIIAHAMWNWFDDPLKITETTLPESHSDILKSIAKSNIGYQPTYNAILGEIEMLSKNMLEDEVLNHVFPSEYLTWVASEEGQWLLQRILNRSNYLKRNNPDFYNTVRSKFNSESEMRSSIYNTLKTRIDATLLLLAKNNANLLFSTDFGVMNMYTVPPGYSGFLEMKYWANSGVNLEIILKSATYNNAKAFNLDHLYGTIEKGKIANLLLINSNPLETIDAFNDIDKVILNGNLIPRMELSAIHQ